MRSFHHPHCLAFMVILAVCSADSARESSSISHTPEETKSDFANTASDSSNKNQTEACAMECDDGAQRDMSDMHRLSKSVNDEYQELVNSVNKRFRDAKNAKQPPPCQPECNYYGQLYCVNESFQHFDRCNTCTCREGGKFSCTVQYCSGPCDGPTCMYGMEGNSTSYCKGESWQANDGINVCICDNGGIVHCTDEEREEPPRVMLRMVGG